MNPTFENTSNKRNPATQKHKFKATLLAIVVAVAVGLLYLIDNTSEDRPLSSLLSNAYYASAAHDSNTLKVPMRATSKFEDLFRDGDYRSERRRKRELQAINASSFPPTLYRHNFSYCVHPSWFESVPAFVDTDPYYRSNLFCLCLEKHIPGNQRNCLIRVREGAIFKKAKKNNKGTVKGKNAAAAAKRLRDHAKFTKSEVIMGSPDPNTVFWARIDVYDERLENQVFLRSQWGGASGGGLRGTPPTLDMRYAPTLYIPQAIFQQNFYHSLMGPHGVTQIVLTRSAIDQFYFEENIKLQSNLNRSGNIFDSTVTPEIVRSEIPHAFSPTPPLDLSVTGPLMAHMKTDELAMSPNKDGEVIANVGHLPHFDPVWVVGRCGTYQYLPPSTQEMRKDSFEARPKYLAREILLGANTVLHGKAIVPSMSWFGRRMGFCQHYVAMGSLVVTTDLWVGMLSGQLGTIWAVRRSELQEEELADIVTAEEYATTCPLGEEELDGLKGSLKEIQSHLDAYVSSTPSSGASPAIMMDGIAKPIAANSEDSVPKAGPISDTTSKHSNISCTVIQKGKGEEPLCVLVMGRELSADIERVRGIAPNLEYSILDALLMPFEGLTLKQPLAKEQWHSKWWTWSEATRKKACEIQKTKFERIAIPSEAATANELLESINHRSGLPPCATTLKARSFMFQDLQFPNTSKHFDAPSLRRTSFDGISLQEQYRAIQSANLFIFEEGAPATWTFFTKKGSTVILVYNSNYERWMRTEFETYVRNNKGKILSITHTKRDKPESLKMSTEFFTIPPEISENVRVILFVYQHGRLPSFAGLREAFDRPWRAESIIICCECNETRIVPIDFLERECPGRQWGRAGNTPLSSKSDSLSTVGAENSVDEQPIP